VWTAKANKRVQFGYGLNYLIDTEHAVIVNVEATPARGEGYQGYARAYRAAARSKAEAARRRHGLWH
jgi:hypothetical protein